MKKTCTGCGSQKFHVEIGERLDQPRRPAKSTTSTYVKQLKCAECGKTNRV